MTITINLKNTSYWLKVITLGLFLGLSIPFVRAWTEPSQNPPGGNVGAPINTGDNTQGKLGSLTIGKGLGVGGNSYFQGNVGIGTTAPKTKLDVIGNAWISGNVGIGTTNPQAKLHVVGNARVNDICLNGDLSKCLSTPPPPSAHGLYGRCKLVGDNAGNALCFADVREPAYCEYGAGGWCGGHMCCKCRSGYTIVSLTGGTTEMNFDEGDSIWACYKD